MNLSVQRPPPRDHLVLRAMLERDVDGDRFAERERVNVINRPQNFAARVGDGHGAKLKHRRGRGKRLQRRRSRLREHLRDGLRRNRVARVAVLAIIRLIQAARAPLRVESGQQVQAGEAARGAIFAQKSLRLLQIIGVGRDVVGFFQVAQDARLDLKRIRVHDDDITGAIILRRPRHVVQ